MMDEKSQVSTNLVFGLTILVAGMFFVALWAIGESTGQIFLLNAGRWGLGFLALIIEIIQFIIKRGNN